MSSCVCMFLVRSGRYGIEVPPFSSTALRCRQRADIWTAAEAVMCNGGSLETRTSHVQTASVKSAPPAAHSPPLWHGFGSHGCDGSNPHSSPEKPPMQ